MASSHTTNPRIFSDISLQAPPCTPADVSAIASPEILSESTQDGVIREDHCAIEMTTKPSSGSLGGNEVKSSYLQYVEHLQTAWPDIPKMQIYYDDLEYKVILPVTEFRVPTLLNSMRIKFHQPKREFVALHRTMGVLKPGSTTLVLAPPGHGKSTFLKALAGYFHKDKNCNGNIWYNGMTFQEAEKAGLGINKMAVYVDQGDIHLPLLTVKETLEFAMKSAIADPTLLHSDTMTPSLHEQKVEMVLSALGLQSCKDTILGNQLIRGVSGGERRRVTIGEMMITNARAFFLDQPTTGLDSATAYDVLKALQQWAKISEGILVTSLLQPTPEMFGLFDRLILLCEGMVVYNGPLTEVVPYFESLGIPFPNDQDTADFLNEFLAHPAAVYYHNMRTPQRLRLSHLPPHLLPTSLSTTCAGENTTTATSAAALPQEEGATPPDEFITRKDYKIDDDGDFRGYPFASTSNTELPLSAIELETKFLQSRFHLELQQDFVRAKRDHNSLITTTKSVYSLVQFGRAYAHSVWHHTWLCVHRQALVMKRNKFFYIPRIAQAILIGLVYGSLFWQTSTSGFSQKIGLIVTGALFVAFTNMVEIPWAGEAKMVIYKQADVGMYPVAAYTCSVAIVHQLIVIAEIVTFGSIVYWMAGFTMEFGRYVFFIFSMMAMNMSFSTLFRFFAYLVRNPFVAQHMGAPVLALTSLFCGFVITADYIPNYLTWLYWFNPVSWCVRSLAQNEFFANRYNDFYPGTKLRMGNAYLQQWQISTDSIFEWTGLGYLYGLFLVFFFIGTLALTLIRFPMSIGTRRTDHHEDASLSQPCSQIGISDQTNKSLVAASALPFEPLSLCWRNIGYTVDVEVDGKMKKKKLLSNINGFVKPGTLTALMGSTGAGKTTLMDLIAGRKTAGKIEGEILVNGHPKNQNTFSRVMGYVEQTDIHIALHTVREALRFSARLRLPSVVSKEAREAFVEEVLHVLELTDIADRLIGDETTKNRLAPGQLKRVTIGVELVANPSILFLDEPTTGLDARSAIVVVRVLNRIVRTGRAVLCTIHQPSAVLFYMFERLLLLQKTEEEGGRVAFFGDIGDIGSKLVYYFENVPVPAEVRPKLPEVANPASWMLDVIGAGTAGGEINFTEIYDASPLCASNKSEIEQLATPAPGTQPLFFPSVYAVPFRKQFIGVLSRNFTTYWRNVPYNMTRFLVLFIVGLIFGLVYRSIDDTNTAGLISKLSSIFAALGICGIINCATAMPVLSKDRAVFYREQMSFTYSSPAYAFSLGIVELPYVALSILCFLLPYYFLVGFKYDAGCFFQFFLGMYLVAQTFNYWGQFLVVALPDIMSANILMSLTFTFMFVFGGLFIQPANIPRAWIWMYYINPIPKGHVAIGVTQFACHGSNCPTIQTFGGGHESQWQFVSEYLNTGDNVFWQNVGYLLATIFVIRLGISVLLAKVTHLKR